MPLYLLTSAKNQPILVELKNGESLNGQLVNCDSWMNLTLKDVIQSSSNGETFVKLPECYIRGNHIKYLRLPEEVCLNRRFIGMIVHIVFIWIIIFLINYNSGEVLLTIYRLWIMPRNKIF